MIILLLAFLLADILISFFFYREAYVVRSNMNRKYKKRFAIMLTVIAGSVLLAWINLPLASLVAGIPASVACLFAGGMMIAMLTHKGPWH